MRARQVFLALGLAAAALAATGCRGRSVEGWSTRARDALLTSGPTEIVVSNSRVPGYWARTIENEQEVFLYTRDSYYRKGNRVTVSGPFGGAVMAAFREEAGVYEKYRTAPVLVVWSIKRTADGQIP